MKKKSCLILAILMVMIQLVSAFAVLPAMAETTKSYNIVGTDAEITVDGKANEAIWSDVESSSAFVNTNGTTIDGFNASFKAIWTPCEEDSSKMNVYIFVTSTGYTVQNSWRNNIYIQIQTSDASHRFWSGGKQLNNVNTGSADQNATIGTASVPFKLFAVNDIANSKTATYEFCYTMPKSDTIKFDIKVNAKKSATEDVDVTYSWVSMTAGGYSYTPTGTGNILPIPEYDLIRSTEPITIDGKANEAIWDSVEYSSAFVNTKGNAINGFNAKYKAVWMPNADDSTKMDVYIFVTSTGYTVQNSYRNNIRIQIETLDASHRFWTGMCKLNDMNTGSVDRTATVGSTSVPFKLFSVNDIANSKTATYEFCYTMPKSDTIKFDIMVNARESSASDADVDVIYSWVDLTGNAVSHDKIRGIGNIIDFDLNDINIVTTPGASIRVDTENKDKSGIRFETKVDAAVVAALKDAGATITTGTLVLPTATLTNNGIADADFTIAKLEEAQLRSGIDYYNIINVGNEWVDGMDGTWFGTVFDVKNLTRQFSAVGYVTVELDGETTTLYGGYVSTNSRSIKDVATILLEGEEVGDGGSWNSEQEAILKNFSLAGTDTN